MIFLSDDFLPSSHGTMFSRVDNFPEKFSGGYPPIFLGLKILVPQTFPVFVQCGLAMKRSRGYTCRLLAWVDYREDGDASTSTSKKQQV